MLADKHFLIVLFAYQLQSGLKEFISAFVINFNCKTFFGFSSGLDESQNTSTAESRGRWWQFLWTTHSITLK